MVSGGACLGGIFLDFVWLLLLLFFKKKREILYWVFSVYQRVSKLQRIKGRGVAGMQQIFFFSFIICFHITKQSYNLS